MERRRGPMEPGRITRSALLLLGVACSGQPRTDLAAGPEAVTLASAACELIVRCDCQDEPPELSACVEELARIFDLDHQTAMAAGLEPDPACVTSQAERLERLGCEDEWPVACEDRCQVFHGDLPVGARCTWSGNHHDCDRGLVCVRDAQGEDRCLDRCWETSLQLGDPCDPGSLPDCDHQADLACVDDGTGAMCRLPPPLGESCEYDYRCVDSVCDSSSWLCSEPATAGEPCDGPRCLDELWCDDTDLVCVPRAPIGEPCAPGAYQCVWDAFCNSTLPVPVCTAFLDEGAACNLDLPCRDDLNCVDDVCTPARARACGAVGSLPPVGT